MLKHKLVKTLTKINDSMYSQELDRAAQKGLNILDKAFRDAAFLSDDTFNIVKIYHFRQSNTRFITTKNSPNYYLSSYDLKRYGHSPDTRGGLTIVLGVDNKTGRYHVGVARCSDVDCYNKKRGAFLAAKRAYIARENGVKVGFPTSDEKARGHIMQLIFENIPSRFMTDLYKTVSVGE